MLDMIGSDMRFCRHKYLRLHQLQCCRYYCYCWSGYLYLPGYERLGKSQKNGDREEPEQEENSMGWRESIRRERKFVAEESEHQVRFLNITTTLFDERNGGALLVQSALPIRFWRKDLVLKVVKSFCVIGRSNLHHPKSSISG